MALILATIRVIKMPKTPIKAKEKRKLDSSAMYPIIGGPIKNPKKLTLETVVSATLGDTFWFLPATLYTVGTMVDTPNPTNIKAIVHGITNGKNTAVKSPADIIMPLHCNTVLRPNFWIKPSPTKRPLAIIIIKEVYPKITNGPGALMTSLK